MTANRSSIAVKLLASILGLLLVANSSTYARKFVDSKGREIEAEIVAATPDGKVVLEMNGKEYTVPALSLSVEDQAFIQKWIEENPEAVSYKFDYYADTRFKGEMKFKQGALIDDKIKTKQWEFTTSITNKNPSAVFDIKVIADVIVEDVVDVLSGDYVKLGLGYDKEDVAKVQRIRAEVDLPDLDAGTRLDIDFDFVIESYVDRDGSKVDGAAADRVLGSWIRIFKGDQMIGDYIATDHSKIKKVKWGDDGVFKVKDKDVKVKVR